MNSLNQESRSLLIEKQRGYVRLIESILKKLADYGKMIQIDPAVATFAFFGMVHYTITWYHRDGPIPLNQLAHIFADIFTRGILLLYGNHDTRSNILLAH